MSKEQKSILFTAMINAMVAYHSESVRTPLNAQINLLTEIANREIERMENLLKDDFR